MKEIPSIKFGEKVSEPGIYDMPLSWYHDDCCIGPSISSSGLRTIDLYSPAHYWETSPLNPRRNLEIEKEVAEKAAVRVGRAAHLLLLEPEQFKRLIVTRPEEFTSWLSKAAKTWRHDQQIAGSTVLDPKEYQRVVGIAASLRRSEVHRDGILDGRIETSLIWQDGKTKVWLKSRPDAIPASANMLVDLKVTTDARPRATRWKIRDMGYDMQMALCGLGMARVLGREIDDYVLVFVEDEAPHVVRNAPVDRPVIHYARLRCRRSIDLFATCLRQKDWPGYVDSDGEHVMLSDTEESWLKKQQQMGLLPKEF